MSKFSRSPSAGVLAPSGAGLRAFLNYEHAPAYERDPRTTFASMAACCLVDEPSFYGDTTGKVRRLLQWCAREYPEWTVKLAVFLREELHLRSISQLILACAATVPAARPLVERAFARVALRPDDMIEIAALLKDDRHLLSRGMPAAVRRAIGAGLNRLGDLQVLKYRRARAFGLKHLLRLCHPRPASARQAFLLRYALDRGAWRDLPEAARGSFPAIAAWEAISRDPSRDSGLLVQGARAGLPWEMLVSRFGSTKEVWTELVPYLPVMALLRNLRNLHECGALLDPCARLHVRAKLMNPEVVRRSRLLPFRFLSAFHAIKDLDAQVGEWIEEALELSVESLPRYPGLTVIACDNSGSMDCPISTDSSVTPKQIASLLGALAERICEASRVYVFGSECEEVALGAERRALSRARQIAGTDVGGATYAYRVLDRLIEEKVPADRLLVFTDMQIYGEPWASGSAGPVGPAWASGAVPAAVAYEADPEFTRLLRVYRSTIATGLRTYVFNLQPYEHFMTPADEHGVSCFSGWSEGLLRYVALDSGEGGVSMVEKVERIVL